VILTGRDPERRERAARELGAASSAAFDATDAARLERFFDELPAPVDHVMVTAGAPLLRADEGQGPRRGACRPGGAPAAAAPRRPARHRPGAPRGHAAVHRRVAQFGQAEPPAPATGSPEAVPTTIGDRMIDGIRIRCAGCGGDGATQSILMTCPWPESMHAFAQSWGSLAQRFRVHALRPT
jgi:hypothetical protein